MKMFIRRPSKHRPGGISIILEDFATQRKTADNTQNLFAIYSPGGQTQTGGYNSGNQDFEVTVTGIGGGASGGCYWHFLPCGDVDLYSWPNGFCQHYIKSGVFSTSVNRMIIKVTRTTDRASSEPYGGLEIGNYAKSHNYSDTSQQGQHYYWKSSVGFYANEPVYLFLDAQVHHRVGTDANLNHPYDPTWNGDDGGFCPTPTHFFDALTRWYWDSGPNDGSGDVGAVYKIDNIYMDSTNEATEPITSLQGSNDASPLLIKQANTATVTYNPAANSSSGGYELTWDAPKNLASSFRIAYKTSSMKASGGWTSGTWDGNTISGPNSAYVGCKWVSPALSRGNYYFGIKPTTNNTPGYFTEISYLNT
jgi:hypothetical protein